MGHRIDSRWTNPPFRLHSSDFTPPRKEGSRIGHASGLHVHLKWTFSLFTLRTSLSHDAPSVELCVSPTQCVSIGKHVGKAVSSIGRLSKKHTMPHSNSPAALISTSAAWRNRSSASVAGCEPPPDSACASARATVSFICARSAWLSAQVSEPREKGSTPRPRQHAARL